MTVTTQHGIYVLWNPSRDGVVIWHETVEGERAQTWARDIGIDEQRRRSRLHHVPGGAEPTHAKWRVFAGSRLWAQRTGWLPSGEQPLVQTSQRSS